MTISRPIAFNYIIRKFTSSSLYSKLVSYSFVWVLLAQNPFGVIIMTW
jgi:hypothetical protein